MSKNATQFTQLGFNSPPPKPLPPPSRLTSLVAEKEHDNGKKKTSTPSMVYPSRKASLYTKAPPELPSLDSTLSQPLSFYPSTFFSSSSELDSTSSSFPKSSSSSIRTSSSSFLENKKVEFQTTETTSHATAKQRFVTYMQKSWFDFSPSAETTLPTTFSTFNEKPTSPSLSAPLPSFQLHKTETWKPYFKSFPSHSFFLFTPWKPPPISKQPTTVPLSQFFTHFSDKPSWIASFRPLHMTLVLFFLLSLFIFLPILPYFVGCEGPNKSSCLAVAMEKCEQKVSCQNAGQTDLDMDYLCSCRCTEGFSGYTCEYATQCPCLSSSSFTTCLGLFSPYVDLYESESSAFTQLSLDVVQLAMAFNLTQASCNDQERLFQLVPVAAPSWAKLAVAYHFQASANYSSAKFLAEQFALQTSSKSYKPLKLNGVTYQLENKRILFDMSTSSSDKFTSIQTMAQALSELRQHFLHLFWTKYLNLPLSILQSFIRTAADQPLMIPMDSWQKTGGSTWIESLLISKQFGSPFCEALSTSTFQELNLAMEKAFGFTAFPSSSASIQGCFQRPTLGVFNVWRLRTGNYPSREKQQALVLDSKLKSISTVTAVPLMDVASRDHIGVLNHMNHVWLDYFWNFPKQDVDLKAMFTKYLSGAPMDLKPPVLDVQVWTTQGVFFNQSHVQLAFASLFLRAEAGHMPDPYFGTPQGQKFRSALSQVKIPLYWSRDALQTQSFLDNESSSLTSLWDKAATEKDMDAVWSAMTPKVNLFTS